jgi:hypothetical protein
MTTDGKYSGYAEEGHPEYERLQYFIQYAEAGDIAARNNLLNCMQDVIEGMAYKTLFLYDNRDDRVNEGYICFMLAVEDAAAKHREEKFNSLRGFVSYLFKSYRGHMLHVVRDIDTAVCIVPEWNIAVTENKEFWVDYNILHAQLTPVQQDILMLYAREHTTGEVQEMLRLGRGKVKREVLRIETVMAPLAVYYKAEQAGVKSILEAGEEDESYD